MLRLQRPAAKHWLRLQAEDRVLRWLADLEADDERSADWLKWPANRSQEFVVGGYIPNSDVLDALLVGYYDGRDLMYDASVRAGIPSEFRRVLVHHLEGLRISQCPFANLPERNEGRWGDGLTAAKMAVCCWLHPFIVARIEFLEWTPENRLRHSRFAGFRSDQDARDVVREELTLAPSSQLGS